MLAVIGALFVFIAVKERISPLPFAERPILGVLFIHAYDFTKLKFFVENIIVSFYSP